MSSAIRTDSNAYEHGRDRYSMDSSVRVNVCVWSVVYTSDREGAFDILSGVTTVCLCLSHFGGVCLECPLSCSALPRVVRRAVY